jgi:hypothetical protein
MNNELLFDWIKLVTSYADEKIIRANQNGPKPADPFVTWQIVSAVPSDFSDVNRTDAGGYVMDSTDTRRYRIGVDVNAYGSDGLTILANLTQSNTDPEVREVFGGNGITLMGSTTIQDLTGLGDTKWVPRYQAEFEFNVFIELNKSYADYIWDNYSITGTLDGDTITIEP